VGAILGTENGSKGIKNSYTFEILVVVYELENEMSKSICAARIRRRTTHTRLAAAAARREREVALRCLAQPGMTVLYVSPHRVIQKCYYI